MRPYATLDDVVLGLGQLEADLRERKDRRCIFLTLYRVVSTEMRRQVVDRFLALENKNEPQHAYFFRKEEDLSISVPLA
jgi:hypothetical protein